MGYACVIRLGVRRVAYLAVLAGVTALVHSGEPLFGGDASGGPSLLSNIRVGSGAPFAGDRRLLATVSPNQDQLRGVASVRFHLARAARVRLQVFETANRGASPRLVWQVSRPLQSGSRRLTWRPPKAMSPQTYLLRLVGTDRSGRSDVVGRLRRDDFSVPVGPVVRVLGVEAGFSRHSYAPGARARLLVSSDARSLTLEFFQAGPERRPSIYSGYGADELHGIPVGTSVALDWSRSRNRPVTLHVHLPIGPSGLYFARLTADDGRVGFAPFVLLPQPLGRNRVAVIFPTNTWEAYNHRDMDGDGWGDTWYAVDSINRVDLRRPFLHRGVPTRVLAYQLALLRWLYQTGKEVDFLSDSELEGLDGRRLFLLYDLIVFLGHHEYMTTHAYDAAERYRDLGGNLMFTSTTNFLYKVKRRGPWIIRVRRWRDLGRPEAGLIGVQYLTNDFGRHQGRYVVKGARRAPWAFNHTEFRNGDRFGHGGIEIDARAPSSPPNTIVLADMRNLQGPGLTAEMTYYETPAGAKVFASGTLNFAGTALEPDVYRVLENVWGRLSRP